VSDYLKFKYEALNQIAPNRIIPNGTTGSHHHVYIKERDRAKLKLTVTVFFPCPSFVLKQQVTEGVLSIFK
jgi:hypothetical protein